jgi:hypothetical protein
MDILWGAWVKQVDYDEQARAYSFIGVFDTIYKEHKAEYPFYVDLLAILACQASPAKYNQTFGVTFDLIDEDAINHLVTQDEIITVPAGDSPQRWYEQFELKRVEIDEPGQYSLSMLVEHQQKHAIPLWVISPKGMTVDDGKGIVKEFWAEDFERLRDAGEI